MANALQLLNENHQNRVLSVIGQVDERLAEAVQRLYGEDVPSPFCRYSPDLPEATREALAIEVSRFRSRMTQALDKLGIVRREPPISARWSFRAAVLHARSDIEELAPRSMRGYGSLSPEAADALTSMVAALTDALDRLSELAAEETRGPNDP